MGGRGHSVGPLPLEGVRVLAVTQAWAGPYAGTLLADWGAEVIIVEDRSYFPIGTRGLSPQQSGIVPEADRIWSQGYPDWDSGARPWNRFAFFNSLNRNKLSATLVNTRQGGRDLFLELAAISDVVLENNPPSTMDGYGLDYDDLRRVKPDIIMARMPGYGLTGPFREFRAWGSHVEGFIGHTDLRSYPDIDPSLKDDVYPSDAVAGITAAFTVAVALRHLQATGEGQLIDSPLSEGLAPFFAEAFTDYSMNGRVRTAMANADSSMAPNNVYPCSGEDEWVSISVGSDEEWDALVAGMGSPSWARDPRYANVLGRYRLQQEIDPKIGEWTRVRTSREVMETAAGSRGRGGDGARREAGPRGPAARGHGLLPNSRSHRRRNAPLPGNHGQDRRVGGGVQAAVAGPGSAERIRLPGAAGPKPDPLPGTGRAGARGRGLRPGGRAGLGLLEPPNGPDPLLGEPG